jgi:MFS family permease
VDTGLPTGVADQGSRTSKYTVARNASGSTRVVTCATRTASDESPGHDDRGRRVDNHCAARFSPFEANLLLAIAFAFLSLTALSTAPSPLYGLYAHHDRFSSFTITIVYAVYVVGVVASLILAGHVSGWYGRRDVLAAALAIAIASAIVFIASESLVGPAEHARRGPPARGTVSRYWLGWGLGPTAPAWSR